VFQVLNFLVAGEMTSHPCFSSSQLVRVLGSKFVDDLPLKADLGASRSLLDTLFLWIVLCDGARDYRLIIDESMFHVCND
jgi:hypothetical protein